MSQSLRIRRVLCALLLLAAPTWGQQVLRVDELGAGGAFTDIQPAIDAASDGDLLLLASGTYGSFVVDGKSVRIVEDEGAVAKVAGSMEVKNLLSKQRVELHGLEHAFVDLAGPILDISDCNGGVLVQNCQFVSTASAPFPFNYDVLAGVRVSNSHAVTLYGVVVDAQSVERFGADYLSGIDVIDSNAYLHSCVVTGGRGIRVATDSEGDVPSSVLNQLTPFDMRGSPGVRVRGGFLLLNKCSLTGGTGNNGYGQYSGIGGLSCWTAGPGGAALALESGMADPSVTSIGTDLNPGAGGTGYSITIFGTPLGCGTGAPGTKTSVAAGSISTKMQSSRLLRGNTVIRPGDLKTNKIIGKPGDMVWQVYSLKQGPLLYNPGILGVVYYGGTPIIQPRGTLNATGQKDVSLVLGDIGIDFLPLYEQVFFYNTINGFTATNPRFVALLGSGVP